MIIGSAETLAIELEQCRDIHASEAQSRGVAVVFRYIVSGHYITDPQSSWEYSSHLVDVLDRFRLCTGATSPREVWGADPKAILVSAINDVFGVQPPEPHDRVVAPKVFWRSCMFVPNGFESFDVGFALAFNDGVFLRIVSVDSRAANQLFDTGSVATHAIRETLLRMSEAHQVITTAQDVLKNMP
jgi:hypothetical protein